MKNNTILAFIATCCLFQLVVQVCQLVLLQKVLLPH